MNCRFRTPALLITAFAIATWAVSGCKHGESKQGASTTRPKIDWTASPITLPEAGEAKWIDDPDAHAVERASWPGAGSPAVAIRFTMSGEKAFVTLKSGACHVLDVKSGESRHQWNTDKAAQVVGVELTLDGQCAAMQHQDDGALYIRSLEDGRLLRTLEHPTAKIAAFALGTDPRLLVTGGSDGTIRCWNLETGKVLSEATSRDTGTAITALAISNDCSDLYVATAGALSMAVHRIPDLSLVATTEDALEAPKRLAMGLDGFSLLVLSGERNAELFVTEPAEKYRAQAYQCVGAMRIARGAVENCFLLKASHQLCCYLGGTVYDYFAITSSTPLGSESIDPPAVTSIDVCSDGSVAATGYGDGRVQFYRMPGLQKPRFVKDNDFVKQLRTLLAQGKADELDEIANRGLNDTQPSITQWSPAMLLSVALSRPEIQSAENWPQHLAQLQNWFDAKPESQAARALLAESTTHFAWELRGGALANQTSGEQFRGFEAGLQKAKGLLDDIDQSKPSVAQFCNIGLMVAMGQGKPKKDILDLWQLGARAAPQHVDLHRAIVRPLLPRWGGRPGDVGKIANRAYEELPGDDGRIAYEVIATEFMETETVAGLVAEGFTLERLREAAQTAMRLYPLNKYCKNFAGIVACLCGDHAAGGDRLIALRGPRNLVDRIWLEGDVYKRFYKWSRGEHVPIDDKDTFLGAWKFLRQVSFTPTKDELAVLAFDHLQQLHLWDVASQSVKRTKELPDYAAPVLMSNDASLAAWIPPGPDSVIALEERAGRSLQLTSPAQVESARLSDDMRQLSTVGSFGIALFDLASSDGSPTKIIPLDKKVVAWDFPKNQRDWCVLISQSDGQLRLLDERGKDKRRAVQLPRTVDRVSAQPNSSLVLLAGESLFSLIDVDSGEIVKLVDGTVPADEAFRSTFLTVNQDGTLAALARERTNSAQGAQRFDIELWDLTTRQKRETLSGHDGQIHTMSFSPDGRQLASADRLGFVRIWHLDSEPR